jgi:hypothetical protein
MDRSAGRFQVSERSSLARAAHIIGLSHLTLVLVCVAWRFALFMPQRLVRLLLFHYHRRSTSCLFCGRSHLPKGHSKGPDAVGGAKAIRSVLFFISASLDLPSPLSAPSFCHPRRHSSYHCREDSTANIRPALLLHLWRSERPFSQRYPLQFCDLSVYTPAPRYFHWFISIKNTAITRPTPSGRPCDQHATKTAYRIARPTYHRRPRSQSRQVW